MTETRSPEATAELAAELAQELRVGDLVLLEGDLGAGKTTFVRGLARGLGIDEHDVQSPTFTLVRLYRGRLPLAHVDLYRLERTPELSELGLEELLDEAVVAVEWGDRLAVDGERAWRIRLEPRGEEIREISVEQPRD